MAVRDGFTEEVTLSGVRNDKEMNKPRGESANKESRYTGQSVLRGGRGPRRAVWGDILEGSEDEMGWLWTSGVAG